MKKLRLLAALAALAMTLHPVTARAADSNRVLQVPGNALVAPFDSRDGKTTFITASNVSTAFTKLTTHWAFWSDTCDHIADFSICLTRDDTVVVDPTAATALNANNDPVGPTVSMAGSTGFVTVTAYQTDDDCTDAGRNGSVLVDDALIGTFVIADLATSAAFGSNALAFGLDPTGLFTDLPDQAVQSVDLNTYSPGTLEQATAYVFTLEELAGSLSGFLGELGPVSGKLKWTAAYYDNEEQRTSLPEIEIGCAATIDVKSYLDHLEGATAGMLRLSNVRLTRPDGSVGALGGTTGAYGILGETVGPFGASILPTFKFTDIFG